MLQMVHQPNVRMRAAAVLCAVVVGQHCAKADFATDIQLSLINGKIETAGGVATYQPPMDGRVFAAAIPLQGGQFSASSPGFASLAGFLQPGEQIRFDVVRELLYWNGTQLAPPVVAMTISQFSNSITVAANDTAGKSGFVLGGPGVNGSVHIHTDFMLPSTAPAGVYGLMLTVGGAGTATFTESDPILVAFRRGASALNPDQGIAAMAALVPVPEPSAITLAAMAAAAYPLTLRFMRRQR